MEIWQWKKKEFINKLDAKNRLSPNDIRQGELLYMNDDIKREYDFLTLKSINKVNSFYEGTGVIEFNIIKCLTEQEVMIKQSELPTEIKKYLNKKLPTKGKNIIKVKCDSSECRYTLETIYDGGEEFRVPTSVKGNFKIVSIVKD